MTTWHGEREEEEEKKSYDAAKKKENPPHSKRPQFSHRQSSLVRWGQGKRMARLDLCPLALRSPRRRGRWGRARRRDACRGQRRRIVAVNFARINFGPRIRIVLVRDAPDARASIQARECRGQSLEEALHLARSRRIGGNWRRVGR